MTFDNKGRIRPAAGPEGHTHSIYQLNDIAASGDDNQTLVSSNGVWVAQTAIPYAMACGREGVTLVSGSPWSTGTATVDFTAEPWNDPFTVSPIVVATPGPTATVGPLVAQYQVNATSLTIRLSYYGSATSTIQVSWVAIQHRVANQAGSTSTDPERV
jgi:hypothetical protein